MYGEAARILRSSEVDLLTSDVFDTLVWRPVAEPHDLFVRLASALHDASLLPPAVAPHVFTRARVNAERRARHSAGRVHDSAECTLEEIWDEMPRSWLPAASTSWADHVDAELRCEATHLRPIPAGCELIEIAAASDVAVVLASDTYLSASQLRELLGAAGVPVELLTDVVTSSDRRLNKSDGLLEQIARERHAAPARVLHVGDNPLADVAAPRRAGMRAVLADVPERHRITAAMPDALARFSAVAGTDGGAVALHRMLLLDRCAGAPHAEVAAATDPVVADPAYQFGATVGGPLLAGFADWLTATAADLGTSRVHYLLREGAFLADVVATLRPDAPAPVLVHASRWVNMRASVFDGTVDELFRALARRVAFRPDHVTEAFDVDPALVRRLLGDRTRDDAGRVEAIEILAADDEARGAIIESSSVLRARLMRYLEAHLEPEHGRLTLCDIGWGGTIQASLTDLLRHEGWDVDVTGLYLLLSTPGLDRVAGGADLRGFLPAEGAAADAAEVVMRTPEIPEQLCTPDLGTLRDIDHDGRPVTAPVPSAAVRSRGAARQGVLDFVALRREHCPEASADPSLRGPAYAAALLDGLAGTIGAPDAALARELGTWEHDDVRGEGHEPLINPASAEVVRFLNAADLDQVGMRELYWVPGAAAIGNPALATQLDAVSAGADAELLCPPSETGAGLVALFAPGSLDAIAQQVATPHRNADGWMMLRLTASAERLRDVRIDFGTTAALVEVERIALGRTPPGASTAHPVVHIERTDDSSLRWDAGHPVGPRHAVVAAGGHLVVPWPDEPTGPARPDGASAEIGVVSVDVVYRTWRLSDDEVQQFSPTVRHRLRVAGSLPRRAVRRGRSAVRSLSRATEASDAVHGGGPASAGPRDS